MNRIAWIVLMASPLAAQIQAPAPPAPPAGPVVAPNPVAPRLATLKGGGSYQSARRALDERRWDEAVERFDAVARRGTERADAAYYWKAYAQNRLGRRDEALATLAELQKGFPSSPWLKDAKALEAEVRQASGRPVSPESEGDEELKLIAINGLVNSDPDRAVPLLEKLLGGSHHPKLKERALFVLSRSGSPRAVEILSQVARGGNPDLQMRALQYLGFHKTKESRQVLIDVYASSTDTAVKRVILESFGRTGERDRVLAAAREEKNPELRMEAVEQLAHLGAQAELWQLYGDEQAFEVKQRILHSLAQSGNVEKLIELARTEKDPKLRREAVRVLGHLDPKRTSDVLTSLYAAESDPAIRREVLRALASQSNVKAIIDIARKETDSSLKREAVRHLSNMKSKEASDFLVEILNK